MLTDTQLHMSKYNFETSNKFQYVSNIVTRVSFIFPSALMTHDDRFASGCAALLFALTLKVTMNPDADQW